jgi:hypothetical protein
MKRALRLIHGCDNDTSAEVAHLLSTKEKDKRLAKTSYSQLCDQAMQSLVLLSCKESSLELEASVKFSTNCYVPISFLCSLIQLLDAESIRDLRCTSKSFKIVITSLRATHPISNMPFYCIHTVKLSEKIQQFEDTKGILLAKDAFSPASLLNARESSLLIDEESARGDSNSYSSNQIKLFWFLIAAGTTLLFFFLFLQYLHIYELYVYIIGFVFTIIICYLYKRQHAENNISDISHFGYDAI